MDAFELLKNDHRKVSQIFEEIESASGQARSQLFKRLKSELELHTHIEESYLYPALENKKEARDITLEAYEEHKVVRDLLAELSNGKAPNDEWDAKLKVLKENVDHHVEEEEGELFDKAGDLLSDEEIERLGDLMEVEKVSKQDGRRSGNARHPRGTSRPTQPAKDESPGVLKRLANLVGLGDSPSKERKTSKTKGTKSSEAKRSSKGKASNGATKPDAGAGRTKSGGKSSSRSRSASKSRGAGKAANDRAASKRSSGKKAASRRTSARKSRGRR